MSTKKLIESYEIVLIPKDNCEIFVFLKDEKCKEDIKKASKKGGSL